MPSGQSGSALKRLLPNDPLPPYAYVPRRFPHPTRDPEGHSFRKRPEPETALVPERWPESRSYLRGIHLFNHGYYWEAHEAWEHLWHQCGRTGPTADFLKGLIAFAAAGVKAREGSVEGVRTHASRAAQLLSSIRANPSHRSFGGLDLPTLIAWAVSIREEANGLLNDSSEAVVIVMPFALALDESRARSES